MFLVIKLTSVLVQQKYNQKYNNAISSTQSNFLNKSKVIDWCSACAPINLTTLEFTYRGLFRVLDKYTESVV